MIIDRNTEHRNAFARLRRERPSIIQQIQTTTTCKTLHGEHYLIAGRHCLHPCCIHPLTLYLPTLPDFAGGQRDGQFDELVIGEDVTPVSLRSSLEGRTIVDLKRRGKQMWFVLDK